MCVRERDAVREREMTAAAERERVVTVGERYGAGLSTLGAQDALGGADPLR